MADNSTMGGSTDVIRDKDRAGVKTEIVGLDVGIGTATESLMSSANPMPVYGPDVTVTGTITATDAVLGVYVNDGTVKTGTPTASSYVALPIGGGESAFAARFSGTFGGGTVWIEVSPDSTNGIDGGWTTALSRQSGSNLSFLDESIQTAGIYRGNAAGMTYVRFRITGATTPSVTMTVRGSDGSGAVFLNAALPAGTNTVGALYPTPAYTIGSTTGTTPATTGQLGRAVRANANVAQATAATLIAAPAAGTRIYVTGVNATNEGAALTVLRLFAGTLPGAAGAVAVINDAFDFALAASGGGAMMPFPPTAPWALPVATALSFAVTVATTWDVTVTYYVAA